MLISIVWDVFDAAMFCGMRILSLGHFKEFVDGKLELQF